MMENESRDKNAIRLPATNGPRPHRCEICQRSFREVATLRKHEQLHRADRPYICTTCNKSFLWSSNLKVHERVHTGERPYKCKICHRCFTQSNDLRRHERNVHMRGKLYSYKTPVIRESPPNTTGHMNMAAYQAFALQQRALLQHALAYETMMQNAASVSSSQYPPQPDRGQSTVSHLKADVTVSTSDPRVTTAQHSLPHIPHNRTADLKLEQVTPPPHVSEHYSSSEDPSISGPDDRYLQSPVRSGFSPSSSKSPPRLSSTTYGLQNGHRSLESPEGKNDRLTSVPHTAYSKYYPYQDDSPPTTLPHGQSAFPHSHTQHSEDGIMDLRVNKSLSSLESEDGELDWKLQNSSKSPDSGSECESKRVVTTTSQTPPADSSVHHCPHCNIVFHDFTMYNLHQSLHSPLDEDPFLCPSCLKHCQDRVEFMFHMVWHVKYPHTIPKYQSFKESYLSEACEEA